MESFIQKKWQYIYMILNDNDQFGKILKRILLNQIVIKRCGVGKNKMTICPDGSIYPCDSFVGIDEFNLGNINSLNKVYHSIENCEVYKRNICNKCEVNLLCGGDCFYHSFRFLYKGIIIKHNKTEPTYTKTSLFLCEKRRFLWPGLRKEGNLFKLAGPGGLAFFHLTKKEVSKWPMKK